MQFEHLFQRNEILYLHMNVHSSFIHKSRHSFMVQTPVQHEQEQMIDILSNKKISQELHPSEKNPKSYIPHDSIHAAFLKWQNCREELTLPGLGKKGRDWLQKGSMSSLRDGNSVSLLCWTSHKSTDVTDHTHIHSKEYKQN